MSEPAEVPAVVSFVRVPLTTPCPVPVEAGTGRAIDAAGEPLPMEQRTELCAVDAEWMMGSQRVCSHHLAELFEWYMDGDYEDLVREAFAGYGTDAVERALERSRVPWADRKRYTQAEARQWAELNQDGPDSEERPWAES